ncbi:hypothetical protein K474DRAFT_1713185 [Panus rudis PR-1116 ss-1]|nr:hypothetical protein K474DRAFT_1713185 [Panus rudis PR-1116 ss-1]
MSEPMQVVAVPQLGSLERETANGEQSDFIQCKNDLNRYGKEGAIGGHSFTIDPLLLSSEDPGVIDLAEDVNWDSTHPTREQPLLEEQDDGLGLDSKHISMVKKIVQAMGDEELVESLIQRGITFSTAKDSQKTRIVASHLSGDSNQFTNETTGDKVIVFFSFAVKTIKEDITDIVELPSGLGSTASVYDLVEAVLRSPSNKTCRIKPMLERAIEQGMSSEIMIGVAEHPFSASGAFQALAFGFETKGSLEDALSGTEMMGEELEPCDKETSEYKEFMERAVWMLGGNMPSIAYAIYFYTKPSILGMSDHQSSSLYVSQGGSSSQKNTEIKGYKDALKKKLQSLYPAQMSLLKDLREETRYGSRESKAYQQFLVTEMLSEIWADLNIRSESSTTVLKLGGSHRPVSGREIVEGMGIPWDTYKNWRSLYNTAQREYNQILAQPEEDRSTRGKRLLRIYGTMKLRGWRNPLPGLQSIRRGRAAVSSKEMAVLETNATSFQEMVKGKGKGKVVRGQDLED